MLLHRVSPIKSKRTGGVSYHRGVSFLINRFFHHSSGNSFTWDDWFRLETEDSSFQDVIDTLLNTATFSYIGTIIPWSEMSNEALSAPSLIVVTSTSRTRLTQ